MRDFQFLLLGNAMTFAGFQVRQMAIAWLVLDQTNSSLKVGIVNATPGIAIICLSLFAGAVVDRTERRRIIAVARFAIMALMLLSAVMVSADVAEWWHFILIGLGIGVMFAFHNPASQSYAMDVVGRERLIKAASINTAISNVANIAAPALGGVLLGFGIEWAFWLLFALYATSYLSMLPIRKRTVAEKTSRSILTDMRDGLKYVGETPAIKWLLVLCLGSMFGGIAMAMMPVFARHVFDVGAGGYGWMLAVQGVGSLVGAVLLTLAREVRHKGLVVMGNMALAAGGTLLFALAPEFGIALVGLFISGMCQGVMFIMVPTVIQTHSVPEMRGRVMSIFFMVVLVFQLGWIVGGALDGAVGPRGTAMIAAVGTFTIAAIALVASPALRKLT